MKFTEVPGNSFDSLDSYSCSMPDLIMFECEVPAMEPIEGGQSQEDSVFGEWDCNDNTPVLSPQVCHKKNCTMDNYKAQIDTSEQTQLDEQSNPPPPPLDSSTDTMSDGPPPLQNGLFQPEEDNSNTEFYYEDDYAQEYALQYDANLAEVDMDMLDAVDLNTLLSPLAKLPVEEGACYVSNLPPSKSDSCLYMLSSADRISSQEHSVYSEQELGSSAELSDLPSDPLFSPEPGSDQVTPSVSVDSLGNSMNVEKFTYDWQTKKNQYMLSFDHRSPTKLSTDDSYNDTVQGSVNSSLLATSKEINMSADRLTWRKMAAQNSNAKKKTSDNNDASNSHGQVTSWLKKVAETKPELEGKTTWKAIRRKSLESLEGDKTKYKSMPELVDIEGDCKEERSPHNGQFIWGRTLMRAVSDGGEIKRAKQKEFIDHGASLLELYHKMTQEQFDVANEALVTPPESFWSVSTASSENQMRKSPSTPPPKGLAKWGLSNEEDSSDSGSSASGGHSKSNNMSNSTEARKIPPPTPERKACSSLRDKFLKMKLSQEIHNSLRDCSTQTSMYENMAQHHSSLMNRSMQTSVIIKPRKDAGTLISPETEMKMLKARSLQRKFRERLSHSLFYTRDSLPDLSFLHGQSMQNRNPNMSYNSSFPAKSHLPNYANLRLDVLQQQPERARSQVMRRPRRELSPSMSNSRTSSSGSRPSSETFSNNASSCSSSSSGIDPGSVECSSVKCRCRHYTQTHYDLDNTLYDDPLPTSGNHTVPYKHDKENVCLNCGSRERPKENSTGMVASHPMYYKQQVDAKQKCLEYLQLSPTHPQRPRNTQHRHSPYGFCAAENENQQVPVDDDRPLKPCLRRHAPIRSRSLSDPYDLATASEGAIRRRNVSPFKSALKKANRRSWPFRHADEESSDEQHSMDYSQSCAHVRSSNTNASKPSAKVTPTQVCQECEHNHGDSDTTITEDADDSSRGKKSVKFSEHVSYHSPYSSPHQSPKKQLILTVGEELAEMMVESPPGDFMVSPASSPPPEAVAAADTVNLLQKKDMVKELMKASEILLNHFSVSREPEKKVELGRTATNAEIGHLVLEHLCPALHTLLLDGMQPHVRSFFGKIRNSVWKVVEESAHPGPSNRVIHDLVGDLKNLQFLTTAWLKFNAFVFGLLNHKVLDYWLMGLHCNHGLLRKHYQRSGFLPLSSSLTRPLFLDLTTALQPLAQLPFQLEYSFEYKVVQQRQNEQMARYLLQKHVSNADQALQEGQQIMQQQENLKKLEGENKDGETNQEKTCSTPVKRSSSADDPHRLPLSIQPASSQAAALKSASLDMLNKVTEKTVAVLSSPKVKQLHTKAVGLAGSAVHHASAYMKSVTVPRETKSLQNINTLADVLAGTDLMEQGDSKAVPRSASDNAQLTSMASTKPTQIISNGEFIDASFLESDDSSDTKVSNEGEVDAKVYKSGVTDYKFDKKQPGKSKVGSTSDIPAACSELPDIVDKHVASPDTAPVEFRIPTRRNIDPKQRWSDPNMESKYHPEKIMPSENLGQTKKKWGSFGSTFGPAVVNFFDKILLPTTKTNPGQVLKQKTKNAKQEIQQQKGKRPVKVVSSGSKAGTSDQDNQPVITKPVNHSIPCNRKVQALCHQLSTEKGELSFKKGDVLDLIRQDGSDWLLCCHSNKQGLVHKDSVKMLQPETK